MCTEALYFKYKADAVKIKHWILNQNLYYLCMNYCLQTCYLLKLSHCNILYPPQMVHPRAIATVITQRNVPNNR